MQTLNKHLLARTRTHTQTQTLVRTHSWNGTVGLHTELA